MIIDTTVIGGPLIKNSPQWFSYVGELMCVSIIDNLKLCYSYFEHPEYELYVWALIW